MSKKVTEEMISAWVDGELSPADQALVEDAISTDESLRRICEGYQEAAGAVKSSSKWTQATISLPVDFTDRVMSQIASAEFEVAAELADTKRDDRQSGHQPNVGPGRQNVGPGRQANQLWSTRTLLEIVATVAAIVVIVVVWQGREQSNNQGLDQTGTTAQGTDSDGQNNQQPKNGIIALGKKNGEFKQPVKTKKGNGPKSNIANAASRKFSVFVNASTRPSIDRFWILNNYEVTAPEGSEPNGQQVNVLLIDSRKTDAVKFFSQLKEWDAEFQVFQQAKSGSASWLAPFDVSRADQAEGDLWTLQIVLINK